MNRETIYTALAAKLTAALSGTSTVSRRMLHWFDVPPSQQPAVFICSGGQVDQQTTGMPTIRHLLAEVWVYANTTDPAAAPETILNNILDLIDTALKPTTGAQKQTLGGLVDHCWVDGPIVTDEGTLGSQGVAKFSIKMLTTL